MAYLFYHNYMKKILCVKYISCIFTWFKCEMTIFNDNLNDNFNIFIYNYLGYLCIHLMVLHFTPELF